MTPATIQKNDAHPCAGLAICLLCGLLSCGYTITQAQSSFQNGQQWYSQRAASTDSFLVEPYAINKAIEAFQQSLEAGTEPLQSALYLLKSYYFKGRYTLIPEEEQKISFDKARALGARMIKNHPRSAALWYWYTVSLIQWDQWHNLWQTTIDQTDQKIRDAARKVVALDSTFRGGGGYRLLSRIYYEARNIPLIKSWPSKDEALEFIQRSMNIAPDYPANRLYFARILYHFNRKTEAQTHLHFVLEMKSRDNRLVEDRYLKHIAEEWWADFFPPPDFD